MRKTATLAALATLAVPATALAGKPDKPKPTKPDKPAKEYCAPKQVGYHAKGTFVSGALEQTAGAGTARRGDDRYSGELVVTVTKANHKGTKGEQTFTVENARVRFHPRTDTTPTAGDRIKVHGKITRLGKKCDTTNFTPTVTVRKVGVKAPKVKHPMA